MREPPRSDLPSVDPDGNIRHLQDVLSALEFLRNDAAKTVPPLFRDMILASLTFLCEAYRHVIRGETEAKEVWSDRTGGRIRRTAVE